MKSKPYMKEAREVYQKMNDEEKLLLIEVSTKKHINPLEYIVLLLQERASKQRYCEAEGLDYPTYFTAQFCVRMGDLNDQLINTYQRALAYVATHASHSPTTGEQI